MSILATDNFIRANANPIDGNWVSVVGADPFQIVSNDAITTTVNAFNLSVNNTVSWPNDQWTQAAVHFNNNTLNFIGLSVRESTAESTGYSVFFAGALGGSVTAFVAKRIAGVQTVLNTTTVTLNADDIIYLEVQGTTIKAAINGVFVAALTSIDTDIASGSPSLFGVTLVSGTAQLAAWSGGDFNSNPNPAFSLQPANTTVLKTKTATFTSAAGGTPFPTFQWYKNGVLIAGATSANYTTPAATTADNGATFYVIATNIHGSTQSSTATLTVATINVVADGDSITLDQNLIPWATLLSINTPFVITNLGVNGQTLATMTANAAANVDTLFVNDPAVTNIVVVWGGTNDFAISGSSVATVEALLATYGAARQAVGWKVITNYMLSRVGVDTQKTAYDAWMLANYHTWANAIVVFDARLTANNAYSNTTYFNVDQVHPNQNSVTNIIAPDISAAINSLLPAPPPPPVGGASIPLLFSKRTTASIAVFACLFAARQAQTLTKVAITIGALNLEHAQLFRIYRQLRHQDVANQHAVLNGIIAQAAIVVGTLNATVSDMPEPVPLPEDIFELPNIQIVVANALASLRNLQSIA